MREVGGQRVPDFFIAGHAKCGTTALYRMLQQHPAIFMPDLKEPMFLATDFRRRFRQPASGPLLDQLSDYLSLFEPARPGQLAGEASTFYFSSSTAASQIAELNPDARVIGIFREPASFLISLHRQMWQAHNETERDFRRALALEGARREGKQISRRSYRPQVLQYSLHVRYTAQLRRYHEVLPPEQILILTYDDLRDDNAATLARVFEFLGVDAAAPVELVRANPSVVLRSQVFDDLVHMFSVGRGPVSRAGKTALKAALPRPVRRRLLHDVQKRWLVSQPKPPDPTLLAELRERFRPEVEQFGAYLGRDLLGLWGYDSG